MPHTSSHSIKWGNWARVIHIEITHEPPYTVMVTMQGHATRALERAHEIIAVIMSQYKAWYIARIDYFPDKEVDSNSQLVVYAKVK